MKRGRLKCSPARFIPVHTGNIVRVEPILIDSAVYPCVYREHILLITQDVIKNGLSLCIQGTLHVTLSV